MASGCPVITTRERPMTEVGNSVAFYIDKSPLSESEYKNWAKEGAKVVNEVVSLTKGERENIILKGFQNCKDLTRL
jgi:hypothetical protein